MLTLEILARNPTTYTINLILLRVLTPNRSDEQMDTGMLLNSYNTLHFNFQFDL